MGLIRKTASLSTLGAVKYTSRREAQTKVALEEARQLRAQNKLEANRQKQEANRQWDEILAAFEAGEMTPDDLTRAQWAKMPFDYQVKCRRAAAQRRKSAG